MKHLTIEPAEWNGREYSAMLKYRDFEWECFFTKDWIEDRRDRGSELRPELERYYQTALDKLQYEWGFGFPLTNDEIWEILVGYVSPERSERC